MGEFPNAIAMLEVPADEPDDTVGPLVRLIEESDKYTAIFFGRMPHTGTRLYRIEVTD